MGKIFFLTFCLLYIFALPTSTMKRAAAKYPPAFFLQHAMHSLLALVVPHCL
jgi:hypothetical protein